jgi:hypothetical protein
MKLFSGTFILTDMAKETLVQYYKEQSPPIMIILGAFFIPFIILVDVLFLPFVILNNIAAMILYARKP